MNLWDKISSLVTSEKSEEPGRPRAADQSGGSDLPGSPAISATAANAVLRMLPKGHSLEEFAAGQIQLLNLETVRADLGDRWPKVSHQVHALVEATLRRMLSPSDIFTQIDEFEYLVIFPNLSEQKASALMYVAAAQIRQKLFGHDPAFAAIRLNATITRVSRAAMDAAPDPVAAVHAAAQLGHAPVEEPAPAPIPDAKPEPAPWIEGYRIIPIKGGGMTEGHLVTEPPKPHGRLPNFAEALDSPRAETASGTDGPRSAEPAPVAEQSSVVEGYPVIPIKGSGMTEGQLIKETRQPHGRMPDFASVADAAKASSALAPAGSGTSAQGPRPGPDKAATIQGYPVYPTKGRGVTEGQWVQSEPRPKGRAPDFTAAQASQPGNPRGAQASPGAPRGIALSASLEAMMAPAPRAHKVTLIGRPTEAQAPAWTTGETGGSSAGDPADRAGTRQIDELQILYQPIWAARRQAVTAYRMKVGLRIDGEAMTLTEFCATYEDPKVQGTINSLIVRKLVDEIQHMRGENRRAIIVASIGRRFIDDESGIRLILDQLSLLSDQDRSLVVLEISDAYLGSWPTLAPRVALIRRVCRNVGVRLSLDHKDFQTIAGTGATMVFGDLADHEWPERQVFSAFNSFTAGASKSSLASFIGGLATSSMAIAAVGAGFDHLSGSVIGEGTATPLGVYPLSTEGFYLQRQAHRLQRDQDG